MYGVLRTHTRCNTPLRAILGCVVALLTCLLTLAAPGHAAARTYTVFAAGDIACKTGDPVTRERCHHARIARRIAVQKPDRVLILGDAQYPRGSYRDFIGSFRRSWGRFSDIWHPAPGNHEYMTPAAAGYFRFFRSAAGPSRRGYYSFNLGAWHIVSLNSNCKVVGCRFGSKQNRWLRADLRRNRKRCIAAFWHHPFATSGKRGGNTAVGPLWKELRKARAELVMAGHDHHYERLTPMLETGQRSWRRGVRGFVAGTGGSSIQPVGPQIARSSYLRGGTYGALRLRLASGRYSWSYVDEAGRVFDRGSARCRK